MKVLKFGGTSVGTSQRIREVAHLITVDSSQKIVVLSAMAGTTNSLVEICNHMKQCDSVSALKLTDALEKKYADVITELLTKQDTRNAAFQHISDIFSLIRNHIGIGYSPEAEKEITAQGEIISTRLMVLHLSERGVNATELPATEFMRIDDCGEPDITYISEHLNDMLAMKPKTQIYITQGFICRNPQHHIDNLQRGGSDYTATLVGEAIGAEVVEIWTDIDGMHNGDPRFVTDTHPVAHLSFEQALLLAYYGAKILHPTCIIPAMRKSVTVKLLNTLQPDACGTTIDAATDDADTVKAVAAKDDMYLYEIHGNHETSIKEFGKIVMNTLSESGIDMISATPQCISAVPSSKLCQAEIAEIKKYATSVNEREVCLIAIVGNMASSPTHILTSIAKLPTFAVQISQGCVLLAVDTALKGDTLKLLNTLLFHQ